MGPGTQTCDPRTWPWEIESLQVPSRGCQRNPPNSSRDKVFSSSLPGILKPSMYSCCLFFLENWVVLFWIILGVIPTKTYWIRVETEKGKSASIFRPLVSSAPWEQYVKISLSDKGARIPFETQLFSIRTPWKTKSCSGSIQRWQQKSYCAHRLPLGWLAVLLPITTVWDSLWFAFSHSLSKGHTALSTMQAKHVLAAPGEDARNFQFLYSHCRSLSLMKKKSFTYPRQETIFLPSCGDQWVERQPGSFCLH